MLLLLSESLTVFIVDTAIEALLGTYLVCVIVLVILLKQCSCGDYHGGNQLLVAVLLI